MMKGSPLLTTVPLQGLILNYETLSSSGSGPPFGPPAGFFGASFAGAFLFFGSSFTAASASSFH